MTATTVPVAAAVAATKLVATHQCVVCRDLPERPFDKADVDPAQDYRPRKPAAVVSGKTPRSFRCLRHTRAKKRADSVARRGTNRTFRFGLPPALQLALWVFQGRSCPCGRKRADEVPPGVTLDHVHGAPCIVRGDHPENHGCIECVTGFLCQQCNRDTVGRLEQAHRGDRQRVAFGLLALAEHIVNPPLRRLLAERPDLLEKSAA